MIDSNKISVVAPLSQPVVDISTGMPTKIFADFIFNMSLFASKTDNNVINIISLDDSVSDIENSVTTLSAAVGANSAAITSEQTARANADSAIASSVTTLTAAVSSNTAAISNEQTARANADSAIASSVSTLSTTVAGHSSSITTFAASINGIEGRWGVVINSSGHMTGIQLIGSETSSTLVIDADVLINGSLTTTKIASNAVTIPNFAELTASDSAVDQTLYVSPSAACSGMISLSFTAPLDDGPAIAIRAIIIVNGTTRYSEIFTSGHVYSFTFGVSLNSGSNSVRFNLYNNAGGVFGGGRVPRNIFANVTALQK